MQMIEDERTPEEIARRMERGLRRALEKPPQRHGKIPRATAEQRKKRGRPAKARPS
jgi:hypothetical protein